MTTHAPDLIVGHHYPALNGLRALAVLGVLIAHCAMIAAIGAPAETLYQSFHLKVMGVGWVGVDLFFILSGFLITGILLDTSEKKNCLRKFYIRRTLRIFPLYYFVLFLYFAITYLLDNLEHFGAADIMYFLYIGNWDEWAGFDRPYALRHLWSLAVEEQFYLIWPALFMISSKYNLAKHVCISTIIVMVLFRIAFVWFDYHEYIYHITITRGDSLLAGALLAIIIKEKGLHYFNISKSLCALVIGCIIVATLAYINGSFSGKTPLILMFGLPSLFLIFVPIILLTFLLPRSHMFQRVLSSPILTFMGKISYGMYVYHWFVIILIYNLNLIPIESYSFWSRQALFLAYATPITIMLSWISYEYIERPILGYKDKLAPYND
ncbi:MAG: hypothetical protein COB36_13895 [Alphaproteobacteria bacterium]|nr:MAG: hypothetical protein COB36_13895 [Alphaproteobacteria bacterium]